MGSALLLLTALAGCGGSALIEPRASFDNPQDVASRLPSTPAGGTASPPRAMALAAPSASSPGNDLPSRTDFASTSGKGGETGFSLAGIEEKLRAALEPDRPSTAQRQRLGDALADKVLSQARLTKDARLHQRIENIMRRLARAAREESPYPARWPVHVIESGRADAFTSGGGHLFITRGMIDLLGTDERIATVLAHEMAHNLLAHVWNAKEKKDMARRAHAFSREVLAEKMRMPWLGKSVSFLVNASLNTYSRQQEYDSDTLGLYLLVRAGWRPQAALETFDFLRRHFREQSGAKNFFYGRHPVYDRRRWYLANRIKAHYRQQAGLPPVRRANWKNGG